MGRPVSAAENFTPIATTGHQQVTVTTSAATLASLLSGSAIPADARHAIFYPETQNVRWTSDGGNPTATAGFVMEKDKMHVFENQRSIFDNMKVISSNASSSATLNVEFYK